MSALVTVPFHGAKILVQPGAEPGNTLVAMKPVVEGMGLDWSTQLAKLRSHPMLSQGMGEITIPSAGGPQVMAALPLNRIHFWMATIHPGKVPDQAVRERVLIFQAEAADALFERFFGAAITNTISASKIGRQVAAIIEDKLASAMQVVLPALVREHVSSQHHAVVPGLSAGQVLDLAGVPNRKGLHGLSGWVSSRLFRFHATKGAVVRLASLGSRNAYVFDPIVCREWLATGGKAEIERKVAERRGQTKLKLV